MNSKFKNDNIIGQTKNVGFQFGLRKTFPIPLESVWDFMFSEQGIKIWLGEIENELEIDKHFKIKEGVEGLVRVFKPFSHIRLSWKKKNWKNISTVQVRIIGNRRKTTISFHQEKLLNTKQRDEMKEYWNKIVSMLAKVLKHSFPNS
ncbi:MAG: SRPBCC domain-containing protein [Bacteroidales bacterium]|jgi:uncharacterized protein YndB with AHSA1/START domain|nr:SRPBCC domain-containing protein [Bacteroidales bacterium]